MPMWRLPCSVTLAPPPSPLTRPGLWRLRTLFPSSFPQPPRLQGLILRSQLIVLLKHKVGSRGCWDAGDAGVGVVLGSGQPPAARRCSWSAPAWAWCGAGCG